jgi:hypothetical protein
MLTANAQALPETNAQNLMCMLLRALKGYIRAFGALEMLMAYMADGSCPEATNKFQSGN